MIGLASHRPAQSPASQSPSSPASTQRTPPSPHPHPQPSLTPKRTRKARFLCQSSTRERSKLKLPGFPPCCVNHFWPGSLAWQSLSLSLPSSLLPFSETDQTTILIPQSWAVSLGHHPPPTPLCSALLGSKSSNFEKLYSSFFIL